MPLHLLVAHFPVALFVAGAVLDTFGALTGRVSQRHAAGGLLIAAALLALLAVFTGQGALDHLLSAPGADPARVEAHTQWGGAGVWLLAGAGLLRALWRRRLTGLHGWLNLGAAVAAAALALAVTLSGTAISHGG